MCTTLGALILFLAAPTLGCAPDPAEGQFLCVPGVVDTCPSGWLCRPFGNEHRCYREQAGTCPNGRLEPGEQCDGTDFNRLTCLDYGLVTEAEAPRAELFCLPTCEAFCSVCGNGKVEMTARGEGELCDDGNEQSHDGCSRGCEPEVPTWQPWLGPLERGRLYHDLVYDVARQRIVLFGGHDGLRYLSDTWEFDGSQWRRAAPAHAPPPRAHHALAYDVARQRIVLFGGYDGVEDRDDTWEYDGDDWLELPSSASPPGRRDHAMTYDGASGRVLLFSGVQHREQVSLLGDTWELLGQQWQEVLPGDAPDGRYGAGIAFDAGRGKVVLFGGFDGTARRDDTWEYSDGQWTPRTDLAVAPPARILFRMAYDADREHLLLFGGVSRDDTWAFDGSSWAPLPSDPHPSSRWDFGMAFDASRSRVVLFGGRSGEGWQGDTWEHDGTAWLLRSELNTKPNPRLYTTAVYDPRRARTVLFGGADPDTGANQGDTWEFDGSQWQRIPIPGPPARQMHAATYDTKRRVVVVFGGTNALGLRSDTWEYDGVSWVMRADLAVAPEARARHAMAYDASQNRTVLFGGVSAGGVLGDTWAYDGTSWSRVEVDGDAPLAREQHALAYRAAGQRVVLFGGSRPDRVLSDTWELDGARWRELHPAHRPEARHLHQMVYHSGRDRVLLSGGHTWTADLSDLWEFDGAEWSPLEAVLRPSPSSAGGLVYDAWQRSMVRFGGRGGPGETWLFRFESPHPVELCNNSRDDDGNGQSDCEDERCALYPDCL